MLGGMFFKKANRELGVVTHAWNLSTQEAEAEESQVQGVRPCPNTPKINK
jgi:hypothetical protein